MTIQIQRKKSEFMYKISEKDPCVLLVRLNKHNARWRIWGIFDTEEQAQKSLLALERAANEDGKNG